jgi:hypothetical protein
MSNTQTNDLPAFNAFVIVDRGKRQDPFWLKVGAAFSHKDGKGLNLVLQALPPTGQLVLRDYEETAQPENKE